MTCQINTEMKIGKMLWGISVLIFSTQFSKNRFPYAMKLIVAVFSEVWPSPGIKCEAATVECRMLIIGRGISVRMDTLKLPLSSFQSSQRNFAIVLQYLLFGAC